MFHQSASKVCALLEKHRGLAIWMVLRALSYVQKAPDRNLLRSDNQKEKEMFNYQQIGIELPSELGKVQAGKGEKIGTTLSWPFTCRVHCKSETLTSDALTIIE